MLEFVIGIVIAYLIRYFAFYVAFKRTGWVVVDTSSLAVIAFLSLVLGIVMPAGAFDFIGILLRLLIIAVFIMILFGEDLTEAFGMTLTAAVIEVIVGIVVTLVVPGLKINPFAVP